MVKNIKNKINFRKPTIAWIKIFIIFIPLILVGFVVYSNFLASHDFNYFYDIGGEQDTKKPYLTPVNRVSDIDNSTSSRNLTSGLVYFDVPVPSSSDNVLIQIRLLDNFPIKGTMRLGAKNDTNWSYEYMPVYDQTMFNGTTNEWIITSANFNLKDLYIANGKLNMILDVPHLNSNKNAKNNLTIPVDWINITVHKDGIFK